MGNEIIGRLGNSSLRPFFFLRGKVEIGQVVKVVGSYAEPIEWPYVWPPLPWLDVINQGANGIKATKPIKILDGGYIPKVGAVYLVLVEPGTILFNDDFWFYGRKVIEPFDCDDFWLDTLKNERMTDYTPKP